MIETLYRARCSGTCQRFLAVQLTEPTSYSAERWAQDATEFDDRADAAKAAADAGWVTMMRLDHPYDAGWLGPDSCCRMLPLIGMFEAICTRTIAAHAFVGPYCPDCAAGARKELDREAAQWWAEARKRALAASLEES